MSDAVNTGFILDMQRKLYRWEFRGPLQGVRGICSILCVTAERSKPLGKRLARNRGGKTPGTDGVTRETIQERPDGVAGFLDDVRQDLRRGRLPAPTCPTEAYPETGQAGPGSVL